jgi:diaminopimelate epimerase/gentisate 1,2-dioxygenase
VRLPPLRSGDGCGNSFALVSAADLRGSAWESEASWSDLAQRACAEGADGLLVIGEEQADGAIPVRIVNRDGSDGGACLNGLRVAACAGGAERGVFAMAGRRVPWRRVAAGEYALDLGALADARFRAVEVDGRAGTAVDFWNPHAIFSCEDPQAFPLREFAAHCAARTDLFPRGVNVEVVSASVNGALRARVWERGVGETQACGSGAVAIALAAWQTGRADPMEVRMTGGALRLRRLPTGAVELAGAARVGSPAPDWTQDAQFFEYTAAADPQLPRQPFAVFPAREHESGVTREIVWDLSAGLRTEWPATAPGLLASFLRILPGESLQTRARASAQMFYVIRGAGTTRSPHGSISWSRGDLMALPGGADLHHEATEDAALYAVSDEPLLRYLGAAPREERFRPTLHSAAAMQAAMRQVNSEAGAAQRNRNGVLLANAAAPLTKTLTQALWSLFNELPAGVVQKPHRHNSVALDLCISALPGTYTLIGEQLDAQDRIVNPHRMDWQPGAAFTTPPGMWHSHHNESAQAALVLPVQDAGLHSWLRTLDIRFS